MSLEVSNQLNPLRSVWLQPRKTIEQIVATQPTRWVPALAMLGGMSGVMGQMIGYRFADWRILAFGAIGGASLAVVNLYVASYVIAWLGRMMGGHASAQTVRAPLAWSQLPSIVGLIIAAAMAYVLFGRTTAAPLLDVVLHLIVAVTALWSFVVVLLMLSRVQQFGFWRTITVYIVGVVLPLPLTLALLTRTFLFQPFHISSVAMAPTLLVGDYMFVNKFAYGYSRFSLPFRPWGFSGRVFATDPEPGDVVVFALPKEPSVTYVKRVVGGGGDRVQMRGGVLHINGTPVARERLPDAFGDFCGQSAAGLPASTVKALARNAAEWRKLRNVGLRG